jgi:hypothetical protein
MVPRAGLDAVVMPQEGPKIQGLELNRHQLMVFADGNI